MKLRRIVTFIVLFIFCVSISLLQFSCTKTVTKIISDTVKHDWQPVSAFNMYGVSELGSASIGDSILVVASNNNYITVPVNGNGLNDFMGYPLVGTTIYTPAYGIPFINSKLCAYATPSSLYVMSVPNYSQYSNLIYTPAFTPGCYSIFQQSGTYPTGANPSSLYPVIHNKYLLAPVEENPTDQWKKVRFDLISFDSSKILSPLGTGGLPTVKTISLSIASGTTGFFSSGYFCAAFYNKFFVSYGGQFFRVDTAGNAKAFGYLPAPYPSGSGIYNMFTFGATLFANTGGGLLFSSLDQGETWSLFNDFSSTNVRYVVFRNVGTKLYATAATMNTQLFKVTFSGRNLNFSELNNDGLENNLITSITQCGPYDFITTASGVFYRDTAHFDQLKTPIR